MARTIVDEFGAESTPFMNDRVSDDDRIFTGEFRCCGATFRVWAEDALEGELEIAAHSWKSCPDCGNRDWAIRCEMLEASTPLGWAPLTGTDRQVLTARELRAQFIIDFGRKLGRSMATELARTEMDAGRLISVLRIAGYNRKAGKDQPLRYAPKLIASRLIGGPR